MPANWAGKRVLLLSDNDGLSRLIELHLKSRLLEVVRFALHPSRQWEDQAETDRFDLIVLALSSPAGDPVVALAQAALDKRSKPAPLLIISERPVRLGPGWRAIHLDFPFEIDELYSRVNGVLGGNLLNRVEPKSLPPEVGRERWGGTMDRGRQTEYWIG